jgi:hypothetical protein
MSDFRVPVPDLDLPPPRPAATPRRDETVTTVRLELDYGAPSPPKPAASPWTAPDFADADPAMHEALFAQGGPYRTPAMRMQPRPRPAAKGLAKLACVPMDIWKRVAAYTLLAMLLGNACRCGGMSFSSNVVLGLLVLLGLAGCAACAREEGG